MSYYASEYTIHFDDTMAYGSHHFLTGFKFQCAIREDFLFGERIFDVPGVPEVLDRIHLFTADAYCRNLSPAVLGDRLAILLTLEEWGRASARFCYRVIGASGTPICAGFQNMICADPKSGTPIPIPSPLWEAMQSMREIEESYGEISFRDRVLAGGSATDSLFGQREVDTAMRFLRDRHPSPGVISPAAASASVVSESSIVPEHSENEQETHDVETWVFAGQGAFDSDLLQERVQLFLRSGTAARATLDKCARISREILGGDSEALLFGSAAEAKHAVQSSPLLLQFGIHLQNMLGGLLCLSTGRTPDLVMGHSLGEIAAMSIAGWFDLATGVQIVCERARAIEELGPSNGGLVVVSGDRSSILTEAYMIGLSRVTIAGRNHNKQTVVSGPKEELQELREHLLALGISAVEIPSQTSFHHPSLRAAAMAWRSKMNEMQFDDPKLPVYSPNGRRLISDDENIVGVLSSQLIRPFDLQGAVGDVVASGTTRLVDCGSNGSLARILGKLAPEDVAVEQFGTKIGSAETEVSADDRAPSSDGSESAVAGKHSSTRSCSTDDSHAPLIAVIAQGCILPAGADRPERLHAAVLGQRSGLIDQSDIDPNWVEDFYSETLVSDRSTSRLTGRVDDGDIKVPRGVDATAFESFSRSQKLLCLAVAPCLGAMRGADRVLCLIGATADGFEDHDTATSLQFADIDSTKNGIADRLGINRQAYLEPHSAVQAVFDRLIRPGIEVRLIDAACASSLYTVTLGMLALEANEADVVLAGGVFCPGPGNSCLFSQFKGTTSTGCRPFDAGADGVVFSEGSAVVALRRLDDAEALGLPIQAVIRGAGVSSDGRSSSANVPQSDGQIVALERCYEKYGIDPASIDAIEAHGTSTPVGDATELKTLRRFYAGRKQEPLPVHSIKGLLGHAGWSAGTASIISACQCLKTGIFPAQAGFTTPSSGLEAVQDTVFVPTEPVQLRSGRRRIAVDGFGFGGANAHLVLENYDAATDRSSSAPRPTDDELVFVAFHEMRPKNGRRFDRKAVKPPDACIMLPDLADDLDITQTLAVNLVDTVTSKLGLTSESDRRSTGILLAQSGKTERGVEATMRVLKPRLSRMLNGLAETTQLEKAYQRTRPSGPYTLQCMMPNVASGRAALHANLHGPNFVVDAGQESFEVAMDAAKMLLRGNTGTHIAIVAAVSADAGRFADGMAPSPVDEYAVALAVTTKNHAERVGLNPLASVEPTLSKHKGEETTVSQQLRRIVNELAPPLAQTARQRLANAPVKQDHDVSEFPIHTPLWVESPLRLSQAHNATHPPKRVAAIVPAHREQIRQVIESLSRNVADFMIIVAGSGGQRLAAEFPSVSICAVEVADDACSMALANLDQFAPDFVVGIEFIQSWDPSIVLEDLAIQRTLTELFFLVARRYVERIKAGTLELWGLLLDAWNRVVHPRSGAFVGFLKATRREIPTAKVGLISTRGVSLDRALELRGVESKFGRDEIEVVYNEDTRLVRRYREVTTRRPWTDLNADSVVVATGGARGVTAILIESLVREYGCKVIALGRSALQQGPSDRTEEESEREFYESYALARPEPTLAEMKQEFESVRAGWEAHQTIQELQQLGDVEYLRTDITDREQVARAIKSVISRHGTIDLLLHGAGVQYSKRLEDRTLVEFRRTLNAKVSGLNNLVDECRVQLGRSVDAHLLTSAYSIFGNDGQHDYGAANEMLDRLCDLQRAHGHVRWNSVAWLAWDGIGMTRGTEYKALAQQRGLASIGRVDGTQIFKRVISGATGAAINLPLSATEHVSYAIQTVPTRNSKSRRRVVELPIKLATVEWLQHHLVNGIPTLPGTWSLKFLLEAAREIGGASSQVVTIQNAKFQRFVHHKPGAHTNMRAIAEETSNGIVAWLVGDVLLPKGDVATRDAVYAQASFKFEAPKPNIDQLATRVEIGAGRPVKDPFCAGQHSEVALSGPFDCLRDIVIGPAGRKATFTTSSDGIATDQKLALLIDASLRLGAMFADGRDDLCVPIHIRRLVVDLSAIETIEDVPLLIQAMQPNVVDRNVITPRTEARDEAGQSVLTIDDAHAIKLNASEAEQANATKVAKFPQGPDTGLNDVLPLREPT